MKSIQFPDMFSRTVTNLVEDREATSQNLKTLLLSDKNSLFGDPYFGTGLRRYLYDQNDLVLRDILIDDLYTAIAQFMPQLRLTREDIDITSDGAKVNISIRAINQLDFQTDLYNIVLFDTIA